MKTPEEIFATKRFLIKDGVEWVLLEQAKMAMQEYADQFKQPTKVINYLQVLDQTDEEKFLMYMGLKKEELAKMLIQCNKLIGEKFENPIIYTSTTNFRLCMFNGFCALKSEGTAPYCTIVGSCEHQR